MKLSNNVVKGLMVALGVSVWASSSAMTSVGPIQRGDSLWGVAQHHRISGVSMSQMISAIKALNPSAFNNGQLQVGVTLQVPTTQTEVQESMNGGVSSNPQQQVATVVTPAPSVPQATGNSAPNSGMSNTGGATWPSMSSASGSSAATSGNGSNGIGMSSNPNASTNNSSTGTGTGTLSTAVNNTPAAAPTPAASSTATAANPTGPTSSLWSWIWFVLCLVLLGLYLRSRMIVIQLRRGQTIVAQRLGAKHKEGGAPAEVARYETLGMKRNVRSQPQSGEGRVIADVMIDIAEERYEAAEKKLINAIRQNKRSLDLRMKLLDLYIAMDNQNAFNKQAEYLLKHMVNENDEVWAQIRSMYLKKWVYDE